MSKQMKDAAKPQSVFHRSSYNNSLTNDLSSNQYSLLSNTAESLKSENNQKYNDILNLQKTAGNQTIQRLIKSGHLQTKLKVSHPNDPYEQEADRVAEQVMRMSVSNNIGLKVSNKKERISRNCSSCEMKKGREEKMEIGRRSSTVSGFEASDQVTNEINSIHSSTGVPLDAKTREFMESRFRFEFGNVKIHTDDAAARSAESLNAVAYTTGSDIIFGNGQYQPATLQGRKLLAHELAHVIQQNKSVQRSAKPEIVQRQPKTPIDEPSTEGLGIQPDSRGLHILIEGHASPRWKGAANVEEANRLNDELSKQRRQAVHAEIENFLRKRLGGKMTTAKGITYGFNVKGLHMGSIETRQEAGGDLKRNDEIFRRVNVHITFQTSKTIPRVQKNRTLAYTRRWYVTVRTLRVGGMYGSIGKIRLALKNGLSGRVRFAEAWLVGPGGAIPLEQKNVGKKDNPIWTKKEIGFRQFEDTLVVVDMLKLVYPVGWGRLALWFPLLGADSIYSESGTKWGSKPGGYAVDGILHLKGYNPNDDYIEKTTRDTVQHRNQLLGGIILTFPTGEYELPKTESDNLKTFLEPWYHLLTDT